LDSGGQRVSADRAALIAAVDALLPQTQCQRCGHGGCRPYAEAVVDDGVSVALCPPGGEATRQRLAALLGREDASAPLCAEPLCVAEIRECDCIGCTQCLDACPVDAIIGAAGRMHTVFSAWCTGCGLCVPACPTDCITLPVTTQSPPSAADNLRRHARRTTRLAGRYTLRRAPALVEVEAEQERLRAAVLAAVARKRGAP
jgi:electron transport complex protein RnfB